jgi:hypothetical protein
MTGIVQDKRNISVESNLIVPAEISGRTDMHIGPDSHQKLLNDTVFTAELRDIVLQAIKDLETDKKIRPLLTALDNFED